jgi:hypothetical protein
LVVEDEESLAAVIADVLDDSHDVICAANVGDAIGNGRSALRRRVNHLLAERGADVRMSEARGAAEREMLGDYFLVAYPDRHVIARDHVDLYEFAREIGALERGLLSP